MPIKSFTHHLDEAKFTSQHYEAIAAIIRNARRAYASGDAGAALDMVVRNMSVMFAADNPNFRKDQFMNATKHQP